MPRSTIRRPSPELDLSAHFRMADDLPPMLTSESLFANDRPLEVEIGSGKGLFMATASQQRPQHNFLGIEIATKYARHAAARLAKVPSDNAMMVAGNAEPMFQKQVPAESLEAIHVYFPDPWWKKRHRKRRVVNEVSVRHYCQAIRQGGRFHFWTDVLDYFEMTIEMIAQIVPQFGVPIPEEEAEATHDLDYHTHFERRSRQHHIPVYRVRFEKRCS